MVLQHETFSLANQHFLMWLRTLCDSVLHAYLSKIADTPEKRNYLHVVYSAAITSSVLTDSSLDLAVFFDDITQILGLYPPIFQRCGNPHVLLDATRRWKVLAHGNYLRDFLLNPERSKLFHYDPGLWSAVVAVRYMKYLRRIPHLRWDMRSKGGHPTF